MKTTKKIKIKVYKIKFNCVGKVLALYNIHLKDNTFN